MLAAAQSVYQARHGIAAWAIGSGFGGMASFVVPVDKPLAAVLTIALSGVVAAILSNWPKIMTAKQAARGAESDRWQRETAAVIERIHASYKQEIHTLRLNTQRYQQIIGFERKAKHAVVSEWTAANLYAAELRELLIRAGVDNIPDRKHQTYREVIGPYDDQIADVLALIPAETAKDGGAKHETE